MTFLKHIVQRIATKELGEPGTLVIATADLSSKVRKGSMHEVVATDTASRCLELKGVGLEFSEFFRKAYE